MDKAEQLALEAYPQKMEFKEEIDLCTPYGRPYSTYKREYDANRDKREAFIAGYELSHKNTIERVCEWLEKNGVLVNLDDLREAMNNGH
jgi:hypothetical protein